MTRYTPSRQYMLAGVLALALAAFSGWFATEWIFALAAAALFVVSGLMLLWLAFRPCIELTDKQLRVGALTVSWSDIRRVDRTGWISPLVVQLTLSNSKKMLLIFPGDLDASNSLLRQLRRYSREALIDGIPYRQFWGDALPSAPERRDLPSPKYQLLRSDDEAEVERLYQVLKTVGHLDNKNSPEEK